MNSDLKLKKQIIKKILMYFFIIIDGLGSIKTLNNYKINTSQIKDYLENKGYKILI